MSINDTTYYYGIHSYVIYQSYLQVYCEILDNHLTLLSISFVSKTWEK